MNIVIPMAGAGSRFLDAGYDRPKPLIEFGGKTMIEWTVDTLGIPGRYIFVIRKGHDEEFGLATFLQDKYPGSVVIPVDTLTEGPACTVLLAEEFIDNDEELVTANCDQVLDWDPGLFLSIARELSADGVVVTYPSTKKINSYAWLGEDGTVTHMKEKEGVSPYSLNGIHYWKRGRYFVESTKEMMQKNDRVNGEFYISLTYNYLIQKGCSVRIHHIDATQHHAVGIPADLEAYKCKHSM